MSMGPRCLLPLALPLALALLPGCVVATPVLAPAPATALRFALTTPMAPIGIPAPDAAWTGGAAEAYPPVNDGRSGGPAGVPAPARAGRGGGGAPVATPPVVNAHVLERVAAEPIFSRVAGVAVDPAAGMVYACEPLRHQVWAIDASGRGRIVAGTAAGGPGFDGDGLVATASRLDGPVGLAYDVPSRALLVADAGNRRLRYWQPGGLMYTLAGGGADAADAVARAADAAIGAPFGVASDADGRTWFSERDTGRVRRVDRAGALDTPARLPAGHAGALAVQAATGRVWVSDDAAVWRIDPARTPMLQPVPVYAPTGLRITALAHDQRRGLLVATTSATAPGTTEARVWRVPLDADGGPDPAAPVTLLAGRGGMDPAAAAYALGADVVPAAGQLLAGAGFCGLAVDWTRGADRPDAAGLVYGATSYAGADPAAWRGEVFKLTPGGPETRSAR